MMVAMAVNALRTRTLPAAWLAGLWQRLQTTWRIVHLGALVLALALSPSTYRAPWRAPLAAQVLRSSLPLLAWFTLLAAIVSVVVTRIVLVTALSYGLTQYALEMVVRVLVLELIPLSAAFAVALRVAVPMAGELAVARQQRRFDALRQSGGNALRGEIAPRALASVFCVLLLAAVSSAVALVLAYLMAHGFSPWALQGYTRMVGHVFNPAVSLVFVLKTGALALAVSLVPLGSALHSPAGRGGLADLEMQGLVRMFVVMLLVETAALAGNYL
jgi:phospholipid/cholesterol/gamma-HCH transport system permease protein